MAYRTDKSFYLPKFNVEKNPFAPKPAESSPARMPEAKKVSAALLAKTQKIPVFAAQPAMPTRATSWKEKLNPFRAPQPTRLASTSAVQVELSLEAVKVVHNDLADADIEVVPVKSRTVASPEAPMLSPARSSWEFLGERLVKQS